VLDLEVVVIAEFLLTSVLIGAGLPQDRANATPGDVRPAQFLSGSLPPLPVVMLSGGQVFLELVVDVDGRVAGVRTLRSSPTLTTLVTTSARTWRFEPSLRSVDRVASAVRFSARTPRVSRVFVGAIFGPPSLSGRTHGGTVSEGDAPDPETPLPIEVVTPAFPLDAFGGGVVLIEVQVETDGRVSNACVLESAPPFDGLALDAARRFRFRPAVVEGRPVPAFAYLLFGFPPPITDARAR
jgi:TonB family protein